MFRGPSLLFLSEAYSQFLVSACRPTSESSRLFSPRPPCLPCSLVCAQKEHVTLAQPASLFPQRGRWFFTHVVSSSPHSGPPFFLGPFYPENTPALTDFSHPGDPGMPVAWTTCFSHSFYTVSCLPAFSAPFFIPHGTEQRTKLRVDAATCGCVW